VRDVHEYILQIYGLEVNRSGKFWAPYLQFELDQLFTINSEEERGKQLGRIRSIYRRRVIFPTSDMLLTWKDYCKWEIDPSEVERIRDRHDQALKKLDAMVNFEEKF
jgi:hypothetical protein